MTDRRLTIEDNETHLERLTTPSRTTYTKLGIKIPIDAAMASAGGISGVVKQEGQ